MSQCKKVFVFGSADVGNNKKLPETCINTITTYAFNNKDFIVSDCAGVDTMTQDLLKLLNVQNVSIITAGEYRYNACPEKWKYIDICNLGKNYYLFNNDLNALYKVIHSCTKEQQRLAKDYIACKMCDYAFGIFLNPTSSSSRQNITNLIDLGKNCYIYSDPKFYKRSDDDRNTM